MAKRTQLASLAISRGGGKKTIFATGGTSGAEKYSPEEKEKEKEKEKEGRGEIKRSAEDEEGKTKEDGDGDADGRGRGWKRLIEEQWRKWK